MYGISVANFLQAKAGEKTFFFPIKKTKKRNPKKLHKQMYYYISKVLVAAIF